MYIRGKYFALERREEILINDYVKRAYGDDCKWVWDDDNCNVIIMENCEESRIVDIVNIGELM